MWIQTTSSGTARLYDAALDLDVEFSSNGTAQVDEDVGAALIDRYGSITEYESDSGGTTETDS